MKLLLLAEFFPKYKWTFIVSLLSVLEATLLCCSANTYSIIQKLAEIRNTSFNTADKYFSRLLDSKHFQIDDKFWRCYLNLVFSALRELSIINYKQNIFIQVDFTSNENYFLILCASMLIGNKAIPLYFTMRRYPVRAGMYDHKKMESAFIKGLKHVLSKKHSYTIVADRGFGNRRFMDICSEAGFEYVIRVKKDHKDYLKEAGVLLHEKDSWCLATSNRDLEREEVIEIYENRFKIEKVFQDLKSGGFEIERSKIRKYDRYKRILFLSMLAHTLQVIIGYFIDKEMPDIKKKYPVCIELHTVYSR